MAEATQAPQPTLEQTLNRTDLGHTLFEHRKTFFGILIAVLVGATGYVLWNQSQKNAALDTSVKVFEFQSGAWVNAKTGKSTPAELVTAFQGLDAKVQSAPVMLPVVLEMSKFLYDKGNFSEADAILSKVITNTKHPLASFFVSMQRAVVLEKLGKIDEAILMIEPLAQSKDVVMPAKVSVELGRLYLAQGDKGKAQTQFDYVLNTFPNDEQAKLAKLYLSQMSK
jgi:predicted negative regulator of RcsB-dependent stress response